MEINDINIYDNEFAIELIEKLTELNVDINKRHELIPIIVFLCEHSIYLRQIIFQDINLVNDIIADTPQEVFHSLMQRLSEIELDSIDFYMLQKKLRIAKKQISLVLAILDVAQIWQTKDIYQHLSIFADKVLQISLRYLLPQCLEKLNISDEQHGFFILGLGKLGGCELNYSSDIDIICLFDNHKQAGATDSWELQNQYNRLVKKLLKLIDEITGDGYVFRTDLRLRPDPSSTPIVMAADTAESYYEYHGQNWERSALIKARVVAGDIQAGEKFLQRLTPFIWRKYLDFATIDAVYNMKGKINAYHLKKNNTDLLGYNIKLGRGGIREIEFFAQAWQLIWGGKIKELRVKPTLDVLAKLTQYNFISEENHQELKQAYLLFRHIEHRLQMRQDEQTHILPDNQQALADLANFSGFASLEVFNDTLMQTINRVQKIYNELFFADSDTQSNLVLNFNDDMKLTKESEEALINLGFTDIQQLNNYLNVWFSGKYKALRHNQSVITFSEILPKLLAKVSKSKNIALTLSYLDRFLQKLPNSMQLFALLKQYDNLVDLLINILSGAPILADNITQNPSIMSALIEGGINESLVDKKQLYLDLKNKQMAFSAKDELTTEDKLQLLTSWSFNWRFIHSVQLLYGNLSPQRCAYSFSNIAEISISYISEILNEQFLEEYGAIENGEFAIIALGRLGEQKMTISSDLDLIFIYDCPDMLSMSLGKKSIYASSYYGKFFQRIINLISISSKFGKLYEIDTRLRPSGNKGPLATHIDAFAQYHKQEAWVWEKQALTKARVIYSSCDSLRDKINNIIRLSLTNIDENVDIGSEILSMQQRIKKEFANKATWNYKYMDGGLTDIEFAIEAKILKNIANFPEILQNNFQKSLQVMSHNKLIDNNEFVHLTTELNLLDICIQLQRYLHNEEEDLKNCHKDSINIYEALTYHLQQEGLLDTFLDNEIRQEKQQKTLAILKKYCSE